MHSHLNPRNCYFTLYWDPRRLYSYTDRSLNHSQPGCCCF